MELLRLANFRFSHLFETLRTRAYSFVKCHNAFVGSLYASHTRRRKG